MKTYGVISKWEQKDHYGTIEFSTNQQELYDRVLRYIQDCVDALNYRNMIMKTKRMEADDEQTN